MAHRGFSRDGHGELHGRVPRRRRTRLPVRRNGRPHHVRRRAAALPRPRPWTGSRTARAGSPASPRTTLHGRGSAGRSRCRLFDELVAAFPDARLNLDVKDWHSVRSLAAAIERHGVHDRVLVASFSDRRRRAVLKLLSRRTASSAGIVTNALVLVLGPLLAFRWLGPWCGPLSAARCVASTPCRCRSATGPFPW